MAAASTTYKNTPAPHADGCWLTAEEAARLDAWWTVSADYHSAYSAWCMGKGPKPVRSYDYSGNGNDAIAGRQALQGPQAAPDDIIGLETTCLDSIKPTPVRWLVPGYIPQGKLVLIAGDGGHGKSTITLHLAARLSTGRPCFGLAYETPPSSDVLIASCEDDFGDTVVPRLLVAQADLSRIHKVDGVKMRSRKRLSFTLADFDALDKELQQRQDVRLALIDPAGAYVGSIDDHKDSELRALLGPLSELAARHFVTILLVKHFIKGAMAKAAHKIGGSVGYINSVRAGFVVVPDQDDENKKYFLPIKFNIARKPRGLGFVLEGVSRDHAEIILPHTVQGDDRERLAEQLLQVSWTGPVDMDVDKVVSGGRHEKPPNRVEECKAWAREFFAQYAFPSDEQEAAAKAAGFTFDNLKETKAQLKAEGVLRHRRLEGPKGLQWWSGPGDPNGWILRPSEQAIPFPVSQDTLDQTGCPWPSTVTDQQEDGRNGPPELPELLL